MKCMKQIEVAQNPDELIDGMFEFFAETGITQAYLDSDEELNRGYNMNPWQQLTNGLINAKSLQAVIFQKNLGKLIENQKALKLLRQKQKKKKRNYNTQVTAQYQQDRDDQEFSDGVTDKMSGLSPTSAHRRSTAH